MGNDGNCTTAIQYCTEQPIFVIAVNSAVVH